MEGDEFYDWKDFCDNIMWIYRENLELAEELGSDLKEDLFQFQKVCKALKR